jgi:ATP-binding cassette subfamily F protein 3
MRRKEAMATAGAVVAAEPAVAPAQAEPAQEPADYSLPAPANGTGAKERSRRMNPIKQKQMEDRCAFLEEEVPRIEASLAHTEEQLGMYVSAAETQRLTELATELRRQLAELTVEWEELMLQLET